MADKVPEGSAGTPKRRNRYNKKKQTNEGAKKPQDGSPRYPLDSGKSFKKEERSTLVVAGSSEGNKTPLVEKKNGGQQQYANHKKGKFETPRRVTIDRVQKGMQSPQTHDESTGHRRAEYSQQERQERMSHEEKRYHMEIHRRQVEEERSKRWYHYFLSKPNDLIVFDRNYIEILNVVLKSRPQAQFVCLLCNYYCDTVSVVMNHIRSATHKRHLQDLKDETTIRELPPLTRDQNAVLNGYLLNIVAVKGMSPSHLETRRTIGVLVSDLITSSLKGCSTRLFGSSIHGLGLNSSDVNIDLQVPEGSLPPVMLKEAAELISRSAHFIEVVECFDCEIPFVSFKFRQSGERCSLSLNNERAVSLAILLSKYTPLDPRLTQLATLFRLWGQLTETDRAQDGTWPGYAFYLMTIFYLQQCKDPILPVLNDLLVDKEESESANTAKVLNLNVSDIKEQWKTKNKQNLAALWIGLLRFYTVDFNYTDYTVSIDSSALIPRKSKKIFIVDPFLPTRNVARSITSNVMFYYIMGCLMTSSRYFSKPQTKFGPLFANINVPTMRYHPDLEAVLCTHDHITSLLIQLLVKLDPLFSRSNAGVQQNIGEVMQLVQMKNYCPSIDSIPLSYLQRATSPPLNIYKDMSVSPSDAKLLVSSFSHRSLEYNFIAENCTGGQVVPLICAVCKHDGHTKNECPEEKLPPLEPLPRLSKDATETLDRLCYHIYEKWRQSEEDIKTREQICEELQKFIQATHPTAKLELFGSTVNGFGLKGSDMDICMTFTDNRTGQGLDTRAFIEVLFKLLRTFKGVQDLLPIATAKVPIVKFSHRETKLDGDISLYNVLAMENSKLLSAYSKIDTRARILGYMMKRFSKICHIGDASKGSLSSYAYTLMVIYFLQHCDPPVLPVLQELTEPGISCKKHMVEGCNAYFFQDLTKLAEVWPGYSQNNLSVGELWLKLLIYYTEEFDLEKNVISIRCSHTLPKFEKLWISKGIAIEDPFDLSHNLGSALTRKMSLYILKALRKGRNHFGRPVKNSFKVKDIEAYYLNEKELTDGEPPNDRGCRICKSIGHKERDCTEKKKKGRPRPNKKNQDIKKKDVTVKKPAVRPTNDGEEDEDDGEEDDEEEGEEEEEDSESDFYEESKEVPKKPQKPIPKMLDSKQLSTNSKKSDKVLKGSPPEGFNRTPPGFKGQDLKYNSQPQCKPFMTTVPPNNQMYSPAIPNIQTMPVPIVHTNQTSERAYGQKIAHSSENIRIPTIVFKNSNLASEPLSNSLHPVSFPLSPEQEPTRPPPGFIPFPQHGQQFPNPTHVHPEQRAPITQHLWNYESVPFYARNTNLEMMHNMPAPHAVNNLHFTGMLAPAEQLIWGQAPPVPLPAQPAPLDAAVAKLQINKPCSSEDIVRGELKIINKDFPKKENKLSPAPNKPIHQPFSTVLHN